MARLAIGDRAPNVVFPDDHGPRTLIEVATPVILTIAPSSKRGSQPLVQYLRFHGESIPILAPNDADVASAYGVVGETAVFVVSGGTIIWCHTSGGPFVDLTSPSPSGLTTREFVAALVAASMASTLVPPALAAPAPPASARVTRACE